MEQYNPLVNKPTLVFHADWSSSPAKRWCTEATLGTDGRYRASEPRPVGDPAKLLKNLKADAAESGIVFAGFDFPIGVPEHYARCSGMSKFRDILAGYY
jgi:hypothetical protein